MARIEVEIDPGEAIRGARASIQAAQLMAQQMAAAARRMEDAMGGSSARARTSLQRMADGVRATVGGMMGMFRTLIGGITAVGAAFNFLTGAMVTIRALIAPFAAAWRTMTGSIFGAADFEDYTIQFAQLLGSFEKADDKLTELADIAAKTPFDLPGIVKGTITLQTLSDGVLTVREKLLMVGDAAAKAKQPFDVMAETMGRLFIAAKTGGEMIEELKTITKQGVIDDKTFVQLKELSSDGNNEGGKAFVQIWDAMEKSLQRASGSMLLMSETTNGLFSTLGDAWGALQRTFGAALNTGIRPITRAITEEVESWTEKAAAVAPKIAAIAQTVAAAFNVLREDGGLALSVGAAMDNATQILNRGIAAAGIVMESLWKRAGHEALLILDEVNKPGFWQGLTDSLYNAAAGFVNELAAGISKHMETIKSVALFAAAPGAWVAGQFMDSAAAKPLMELKPLAAGASRGPAPAIVSPSEALNQVPVAEPTPRMLEYQASLAKQLEELNKANDQSRDDSLLAPRTTNTGETVPKIDKGAVEEAKKQADELKRAAEQIIEATRTPMEKYTATLAELQNLQAKGLIDNETYARAAAKAAEDYQQTVTDAAEKTKRAMEEMQSPFQKLMSNWGDLKERASEVSANIAESFASTASSAFTDFVTGAKSAKEAFGDMARAIIADIIQMITRMLIMKAISAAFGGGGVTAGVMHTGGTVGSAGASRNVPSSTFGGAPRFQHGGTVGSGERPIIAEPGEQVLTRAQSKDIKQRMNEAQTGGQGSTTEVNIVNLMDASLLDQHLMKGQTIMNVFRRDAPKLKKILASA